MAAWPDLTEGVSKLKQARPCRTICTSSRFCTGDFPVYRGLQEIKLLHGAARSRFDTGSTRSRPRPKRRTSIRTWSRCWGGTGRRIVSAALCAWACTNSPASLCPHVREFQSSAPAGAPDRQDGPETSV